MTEGAARPQPTQEQHRHERPREVTSVDLFGASREIRILHDNEVYTLRQTSRGKLLLTK